MEYSDLPTLEQVLQRKTLPPICLYNFYIIMRDRLKMEEVLDFYLDLQHHEQLWKRYIRAMQRSGHLSETDLSEGFQSPRVLDQLSQAYSPPLMSSDSSIGIPSRKEIMDSAQRLSLRYLVPSATKEVTQFLPSQLVTELRKELDKPDPRDDPLLFSDVKEYLFQLMQKHAYTKFLRLKVWGNITLYQQLGRLVLGLVSLLAAFTTSLSFIFLGYPPWGTRFYIVIPFWVGFLNVLIFLTGLDPIWVLFFNKSETTTFKFNSIKQPEVKRILVRRSIWLLAVSIIIAVIFMVVFCVIPSKRL